jgi:hypothetical protein
MECLTITPVLHPGRPKAEDTFQLWSDCPVVVWNGFSFPFVKLIDRRHKWNCF